MEDFSASLVREKIVIEGEPPDPAHTVIRSNRILLQLGRKAATERVAIRAQSMHATLRIAAKVLISFNRNGFFLERGTPFDWDGLWDSAQSTFDRQFSPGAWAAVYINGRPVLKTTESPFTDVIEQCALLALDNYDSTMSVAQSALKEIGRQVRISHAASVAAVFTDEDDRTRCGLMNRDHGRSTTFIFTAEGGEAEGRIVHSIDAAASFLEAINLNHLSIGLQRKIAGGGASVTARDEDRLRVAGARLSVIAASIRAFENLHNVRYRPERPLFLPV